MINTKQQTSPWGNGNGLGVLVTNGSEVFISYCFAEDVLTRPFAFAKWGYQLGGISFFSGRFNTVTGQFIKVTYPWQGIAVPPQEVHGWRVIRGTLASYRKVGARVKLYAALKTIHGVIVSVSETHDGVTVKTSHGVDSYSPRNLSFLLELK